MSAYANIARALGAEVRGWDARDTIFMDTLDGIEVDLGGEPAPPAGWEVVVSTAHRHRIDGHAARRVPRRARRGAAGDRRRRRPREDDDRGDDRVRPPRDRARPGVDHRRRRPAARRQRRGRGGWLVVEGDESDRSIGALRPQIAVLTNIELDHHATYASEAELRAFFDGWLADVPHVVRSWELPPVELELAVPGDHNRQNAAAALAALELAGVPRDEAEAALARFTGVGRRFELVGERGGVTVYDDYGHNPTELEATLRTARVADERQPDRRLPAARRRADAPAAPGARRGAGARRRRDRDRHHRRAGRAARRRHGQARPRLAAARASGPAGRRRRTMPHARARLGAAR